MKLDENIDDRLLTYLLWGQTTVPARFKTLPEFQAWAQEMGFEPGQCRAAWLMLRAVYRPLYGEPVFNEEGGAT